jgi:hypothetical protein
MARRLLFISTHQCGDRGNDYALRLIASPDFKKNENCEARLVILLQSAAVVPAELEAAAIGRSVDFLLNPTRLSLSAARNKILSLYSVSSYDLVLFPDDDCFYQAGFAQFLIKLLDRNNPDLLFIRNNEPPSPLPTHILQVPKANAMDVARRINSNNIIISGNLLLRVGEFDERLGLGTPMGGGEDTDFAFRAFELAKNPIFIGERYIGHRHLQKDFKTRATEMSRYWPGIMFQSVLHNRINLSHLLVYRLLSGIYLMLTGRLSFGRFCLPFKMLASGERALPNSTESTKYTS